MKKNHSSSDPHSRALNQRPTSLQVADEMYKEAFLVKKAKFSLTHPELSEADIEKMTAKYFSDLPQE